MVKLEEPHLIDYYFKKYKLEQYIGEAVLPQLELLSFQKHEHICQDDEPLYYLLFFVKGKAKVYCTLSNGKSLLLSFYRPLNTLGDIELVNEFTTTANVQALEDVHCLGIPMSFVKQHLMQSPIFLNYLCSSLGKKLNRLSINSSINSLYPAENRLASYLLATIIEDHVTSKTPLIFNENLTHLAELLGTSYRHLLRTIRQMCQNKILQKQNNYYVILNVSALEALATDLYN